LPKKGRKVTKMKISIDPNKSVYENAAEYFEASKKQRKKSEDTERAVKSSEKELQEFESGLKEKKEGKTEEKKKAKLEWFHQFHWLVTSNGLLAVGGRDAKQNEMIVKKYLKENDLFFHADIHGAPAVVLKDGKKASEKSLGEAAHFAGCYSNAWRARLAGVDVYAVGKDQVQTSAPTGEYMAKGSFLITGKKQYFKGVEMVMYMGKRKDTGEVRIVPSSMGNENLSPCYELVPGKKEKEEIAKELSNELGVRADDIAFILPGRCEYKKLR